MIFDHLVGHNRAVKRGRESCKRGRLLWGLKEELKVRGKRREFQVCLGLGITQDIHSGFFSFLSYLFRVPPFGSQDNP